MQIFIWVTKKDRPQISSIKFIFKSLIIDNILKILKLNLKLKLKRVNWKW